MTTATKTDEKLAVLAVKSNDDSHITADNQHCVRCEHRPCVQVCPAELWAWNDETGQMSIEHAGCLECGSCLLVCPHGAVTWCYPEGGFGVQYRQG